ncbi:ABC transporter permease [Martelella sp. HB161492]|uniref:ABC transporter permease n=1 Tax=Martelella sp. HB161492 TaxID=2720726 RepID=UPI00158FDC30
MKLAIRDILNAPARFLLTAVGVGFLLMAVVGMTGLYRGIVDDATLLINAISADLWVVQGDREGPFAESSSVPANMDRRVEGVPGVASTRRFVQFSYQFEDDGRPLRVAVTSLDTPTDTGSWIPLIAGRHLGASRFEAIANENTGLTLGEKVKLDKEVITVVGIAKSMVDMSGDGMLFMSTADAMELAQRRTSEEVLLARAAAADSTSATAVAPNAGKIAAVLVTLDPAADEQTVVNRISSWGDAEVVTNSQQRDMILNKRLGKLRFQILAFTILILVITFLVVSLIIYTMTLEKLHEIAMLKLIGARNSVIAGMIGGEAALIGIVGYGLAIFGSLMIFPMFPRRIVIDADTLVSLAGALVVICAAGSWIGIARALKVSPQEVLS